MTVYVDPLRPCPVSRAWRYPESCHMIADTEEELHQFAQKIRLRRNWFQKNHRIPHYDLTAGRRAVAVAHGAVEITARDMVARFRSAP